MSAEALVLIIISYLLLVRFLRYRFLRTIELLCKPEEIEKMTPFLAQKIVHISLFYETPRTTFMGTLLALFKPTISETLLKTKGFQTRMDMSKRLTDTAILVGTWISNPLVGPGFDSPPFDSACYNEVDPRGAIAIARVNWLHRKYHILQDDYRYNLALFVLEPISFTEQFGWRPLSVVERHAFYVFWMEIGRRMGIEITWSSFQEMKDWAETYEAEHMTRSPSSVEIAQIGVGYVSSRIPDIFGVRSAGPYIIGCFLNARTRHAMAIPDPPSWLSYVVHGICCLFAFITRHASLPRRSPRPMVTTRYPTLEYLSQLSPEDLPRMQTTYKRPGGPWYYPEPKGLREVWQNILLNIGLLSPDKLPGKAFKSEGYRIEELGPARFEKEGHEEVMNMAEDIQGFPVIGPWSLTRRKPAH